MALVHHMTPWLVQWACWVAGLNPGFEPTRGGGGVIKLVSPVIASQISLNNVQRRPNKKNVISNVHINLDSLA